MEWRDSARRMLADRGFRLQRLTTQERLLARGFDDSHALPPGAADILQPHNPRLRDLERRYATCTAPMCAHSQWSAELTSDATDLRYFRGDNAYLWQYSRSPELNRLRYFIYATYTRDNTSPAIWDALTEDGAFGCFTFSYAELPLVSRDMLDSANELAFLDQHWGLLDRAKLRVVDIGAGYGRLAHRMAASVPSLESYWCLDAVPRSTFLSEYYLGYRGTEKARAVPIDELDKVPESADLAVNIHSFSEMSRAAVEDWLRWLSDREVPSLLIVPNERDRVLSREQDGSRRDCSDLLSAAGYELAVATSTITARDVRELFGVDDYFCLFQRR